VYQNRSINGQQGKLYIVSAPSGAGKTSLVAALLQADTNVEVSISHTTRKQRPGEQDGVNYHFVTIPNFEHLLKQDGFLESAKVFDNYYGTAKAWLQQRLDMGKDVILEIDWQGAQQVRKIVPEALSIFSLPPSKEVLEQRLVGRGQDEEDIIAQRMKKAESESSHYPEYQYLIINDQFDEALAELSSIFKANRLLTASQKLRHQTLISKLLPH